MCTQFVHVCFPLSLTLNSPFIYNHITACNENSETSTHARYLSDFSFKNLYKVVRLRFRATKVTIHHN